MPEQLKGKTAIVTGAGEGLGLAHAKELSRLGANVVINDVNPYVEQVAQDIQSAGGRALAYRADVTRFEDMAAMVDRTLEVFGGVDILVNNAGILRDRSFAKLSLADFRLVMEVHVMGAVHATKAVWPLMQKQGYGRVVMTTSSSGLYGNFGQSNYAAAKMALVGLMRTLSQEGAKYGIRVNCLAPTAVTAMTAGLLPEDAVQAFTPERVSPALLTLVGKDAPTGMIMLAGGGSFEAAHITMTQGVWLPDSEDMAAAVYEHLGSIQDPTGQVVPVAAWDQSCHELSKQNA